MAGDTTCSYVGCTEKKLKFFCANHLKQPSIDPYRFRETSNNNQLKYSKSLN